MAKIQNVGVKWGTGKNLRHKGGSLLEHTSDNYRTKNKKSSDCDYSHNTFRVGECIAPLYVYIHL